MDILITVIVVISQLRNCNYTMEVLRLITIDNKSKVAIYEQIKNQIMELIVIGVLKPHDKLPSIRTLSTDLQLNFNTVKKAFGDLENAGVIYTLAGRGCFIAENALENSEIKQKAVSEFRNGAVLAKSSGLTKEEVLKILNEIYD